MEVLIHELPLVLITMVIVEYVDNFGHRHHFRKAVNQFSKFIAHFLAQLPFFLLPLLEKFITDLLSV